MAPIKPFKLLIVGLGHSEITFLNRLITGLAGRGIDLTLASSSPDRLASFPAGSVDWLSTPSWQGGAFFRIVRLIALMLTRFSFSRLSWLKSQLRAQTTPRDRVIALYRYLPFMKGSWDAVYFPWNAAAVEYSGLYHLGIPVLVSCRGSQINIRPHLSGQEVYQKGLKRSLTHASAVHCVSHAICEEARQFGLDPTRAVVIHPAVDPDYFLPAAVPPSSGMLQLVTTGSLIWSKGYEYLLQALRIVLDRGVRARLAIIGEGPELSRVLFTLKDLNLTDHVTCLGKVDPSGVRACLQSSHVFVLSSLSEGLSNAVLEAMSCALPVVTTNCGGMPEAVADAVEGFLVPVRDPARMADAFQKLAADESLRSRMGAAARQRVLREFSLSGQVDAFVALLESLASRSAPK